MSTTVASPVDSFAFFPLDDDGYALTDGSLVVRATRVESGVDGQIAGEITITDESADPPRVLAPPTSVVFTQHRSRRDLSELIEDANWPGMLNRLCCDVIEAERTGQEQMIRLCDVEEPADDEPMLVIPELPPLAPAEASMWFGNGGVLKSYSAMSAAGHLANVYGLNVAYFDWEWHKREHRKRLGRMFGGDMPRGVWYRRCDRPLPQLIATLRRECKARKIGYAMFDSVVYACGGSPEESAVATRYKEAADSLGVPTLHLAHVPKAKPRDPEAWRFPFGSVFWRNYMRTGWRLDVVGRHKTPVGNVVDVQWRHAKTNIGDEETEARLVRTTFDNVRKQIVIAAKGTVPAAAEEAATASEAKISAPDAIRRLLAAAEGRVNPKVLKARLVAPDLGFKENTAAQAITRGKREGWLHEWLDGSLGLQAAP